MHEALTVPSGSALPAPTAPLLLPKPGRSLSWIVWRIVRGTWFIVLVYLGAIASLLTPPTWADLIVLGSLVYVRGLCVTVGFHRYFSHHSFKMSRVSQFLLACLCCTNLQRGPLWWVAIHREHHRHSDDPRDPHSPVRGGFFWGHCGWIFATLEEPDYSKLHDLTRFPELVWLEHLWLLPPLLLAGGCWLLGGWSMLCWGFCLSTVIVMQGAFTVNSLGHLIGWRRWPTPDDSRNSFLLALLTLGDGWHHNHHYYPHSANHGFFWWEVDTSFRVIRLFEWLGLVWDVRRVPEHKLTVAADAPVSVVSSCDSQCASEKGSCQRQPQRPT